MSEKSKMVANEQSAISNVIGVVSGKGGVGKSYTTAMVAVSLAKQGFRVGILDGDVTGPSIPHLFNVEGGVFGDATSIYPATSELLGIKIISSSLLLTEEDDPIMWRGPLIGDLVTQFYTTVSWGELDYLLIDFPPGTSDVALSAFSSLPLNGIILVTTPQTMVQTIVKKAIKMAHEMAVPIIGVVENMAYLTCPKCGEKIYLYGTNADEAVKDYFGLPLLASLPLRPSNTKLADEGKIEVTDTYDFDEVINKILTKE